MKETVLHAIFLNLRKAYNALGRDRYLNILAGYIVGPRTLRILRIYWVQLQMAAKGGGHYGPVFHIHRRVTQGYPLSTDIFNVAIVAVI